ncbi:hypothetical protein Tco_0371713 [Tanacetum coccineum]
MDAFKYRDPQFQMFIKSWIYLDDEYVVMTHNHFLQYTQLEIPEFRDTLIQHMEIVKKSTVKVAQIREFGQLESSGTESKEKDTSSRSRNDAHADDVDIRPIYDKEQMAEVNSRAKVPFYKTTKRYKPVEQTSFAKKPERQIPKGHRFSIQKTSVVHEKTMTPRSCLRWKPTGKIFKTIGLRWVPTRKIFTSSTTKVDSEPSNGSNKDITNPYECEQTLNVSAGTLNLSADTSFNPKKEGLRVWFLKRLISQKPGLQGILI